MAGNDSTKRLSFYEAFCLATKNARKESGLTAREMAKELDLPLRTYNQYEYKTPMPLHLIARFCMLTGVSVSKLLDRANSGQP